MFLNPNRERRFLNISSRHNWINMVNNCFFFNTNRFFIQFNWWMIFKPFLLREINMSSKRFTKGIYYLRVKSIFSTKYGLDSEIVDTFCESFAAHVDLPKEKWFKYHPPIELNEEPISVKEETIVYHVDPVVSTAYIKKPPFPVRIKEHGKVSTVVNKSNIRAPRPAEQIKVEPSVDMVKDLLVENIDGHVIYF